jgi:HAE1 family hydrophobic/amphiphilic exporter-1
MTLFALISLVVALGLQAKFGGSSFLPATDGNTLAIDVRTPASSSLEYARLKLEAAAALARAIPETKATNSNINPGGGRIYVDIGKSTERVRTAQQIGAELRERTSMLVGAEFTVLDDLGNGAAKPVQVQFTGTDSRKLLEITNDFMVRLRKVPGAVDVGLSQQDPQNELRIELDRGLANSLGISPLTPPTRCVWLLRASKSATGSTPQAKRAMWPCAWPPKTAPMRATSNACPSP